MVFLGQLFNIYIYIIMNKKNRTNLKNQISSIKGEMDALDEQLEVNTYDLFPSDDLIPKLDLNYDQHDYEKEMMEITEDCEETLDSLSSLYLNADDTKKKNIKRIIRDDALALSDIKFSLACSKRALINLMKQLDMGVNDPEMYQSVSSFQKEIRDSIKMLYDLQKKIKESYKDIKNELSSINSGEKEIEDVKTEKVRLINKKDLNKILDDMKNEEQNS